jgi:hypothetical protein
MIDGDDCGAINRMKVAGETAVLGRNLPHHRSHMT